MGRQPPVLKNQGEQPRGIEKQKAVRRSARLEAIKSRKQLIPQSDFVQEIQTLPSSPHPSNVPAGRRASQYPQVLSRSYEPSRKRERKQEAGDSSSEDQDQPPSKRLQTSPSSRVIEDGVARDTSEKNLDPLGYWIRNRKWPKEYFEQDSQVKKDLEQDSWLEEQMDRSTQVVQYVEINGFRYPRPLKKAPASRRRKHADSSLTGSSDENKRESKSVAYHDKCYSILLECQGIYMRKSDLGITTESKDLYQRLLESEQAVPRDSLFRNDLFENTCGKTETRNEARVIQDISRLIVPSAETLATYGATHLDHLIEGVNEGWMGSIPVEGPKPRPDYSVGFRRSAFTDEQLKKVDPLIGSVFETSFFVATYRMYFPFLTCEVKCSAAAFDIADRQNAHSMTVAVRGIVELYRAVKREKELHREILAFSISHNHSWVRIFGHYPIIEGDKTTFYRHPIREFSFTELDGKEKWAAHTFTKNIYSIWMPTQLKRICSAINSLPSGIDFSLSQSASFSQSEPQVSQRSNAESIPMLDEDDCKSSLVSSQEVTPTTSSTQTTERASKKPRNQRGAG